MPKGAAVGTVVTPWTEWSTRMVACPVGSEEGMKGDGDGDFRVGQIMTRVVTGMSGLGGE